MRKPQHLSPTSIGKFLENRETFYLNYLADNRPPKEPQTKAMSVGSAFDAYVKSHIHSVIFGKGYDPKFEFAAIFEAQVEKHNRDEAREAGRWCFDWYVRLGALADLMFELNNCIGIPRFEIDLKGTVHGEREGQPGIAVGVPLNGKPDCFYVSKEGAHVILDWKVNGFYSNSPPSPMQGFVKLRTDGKMPESYKNFKSVVHNGVLINSATKLELEDESWARQLTVYSAQTGAGIGDEFVARIEQLLCNLKTPHASGRPKIRVASHSLLVGSEFQHKTFETAAEVWNIITEEPFHFFRDASLAESEAHCKMLDQRAEVVYGKVGNEMKPLSAADQFFRDCM